MNGLAPLAVTAGHPSPDLPVVPPPMHRWETRSGLRIAADSWGTEDAPLVMLLHGGGQTRQAWRNTGATLAAAGYRVFALDARGHGDSDWAADGAYGADGMVEDLASVISEIDRGPPVLIGASMGAVTSLVAIGESRVEAAALVMLDLAPRMEPQGVSRIRKFMNRNGFDSLEEVTQAVQAYRPQRDRPPSKQGLARNLRLGSDGRLYWHWDPRLVEMRHDLTALEQRLEACARKLAVPTLLVRGGLSDLLSEGGTENFRAACPHAEYVCLAQAGHMIVGDSNEAFSAALLPFLRRVAPPNRPPSSGCRCRGRLVKRPT